MKRLVVSCLIGGWAFVAVYLTTRNLTISSNSTHQALSPLDRWEKEVATVVAAQKNEKLLKLGGKGGPSPDVVYYEIVPVGMYGPNNQFQGVSATLRFCAQLPTLFTCREPVILSHYSSSSSNKEKMAGGIPFSTLFDTAGSAIWRNYTRQWNWNNHHHHNNNNNNNNNNGTSIISLPTSESPIHHKVDLVLSHQRISGNGSNYFYLTRSGVSLKKLKKKNDDGDDDDDDDREEDDHIIHLNGTDTWADIFHQIQHYRQQTRGQAVAPPPTGSMSLPPSVLSVAILIFPGLTLAHQARFALPSVTPHGDKLEEFFPAQWIRQEALKELSKMGLTGVIHENNNNNSSFHREGPSSLVVDSEEMSSTASDYIAVHLRLYDKCFQKDYQENYTLGVCCCGVSTNALGNGSDHVERQLESFLQVKMDQHNVSKALILGQPQVMNKIKNA